MAKKGQSGFTLVELLVCIVVGSIVTMAAVTVLLMGLRINKQSTGTVSRQNTTRVLMTALEDVATEGNIAIEIKYNAWEINNGAAAADKTVYFSYNSDTDAIYTGAYAEGKKPLLDGVLSSSLELDDQLLTILVVTGEGEYRSSVYCRAAVTATGSSGLPEDQATDLDKTESETVLSQANTTAGRTKFLETLFSQYALTNGSANIGGLILKNGYSTGTYYSQWYIRDGWGKNGWGPDTPWCACFVTWGIYKAGEFTNYTEGGDEENTNIRPSFAGVDSFRNFFQENKEDNNEWIPSKSVDPNASNPQPGDVVFFDWERDGIFNMTPDPDHVGVVLTITQENNVDYLYTIEGNSSNMVAIRRYQLNDHRILGYGVLDWKADDQNATPES